MKCEHCGEEILAAEVCPYCGRRAEWAGGDDEGKEDPQGEFRGVMAGEAGEDRSQAPGGWLGFLRTLCNYLKDPSIPWLRKSALFGGLLYLFSPLDIVPDLVFGFGWLDDVAVIALVWRFISDELRRYRQNTKNSKR